MGQLTDKYLTRLFEIQEQITSAALGEAILALIDFLGCAADGSKRNATLPLLFPLSKNAKCCIIGSSDHRTMAEQAAYVNAFNAHSTELDDGYKAGMTHIGAVVVSAVVALAQENDLGMSDALRGIVMGYEATARLARAVNPGHKKRGFHTTGTCALIGATVGAAMMLGADFQGLKSAVSSAATSAAGLLEIQEDGSQLKPVNAAHAAMAAVTSARLSKANFAAPKDILGGDRGFANLLTQGIDIDELLKQDARFAISQRYMKLYPACRHCHPAIEAALAASDDVDADDIDRILVETYSLAIKGHDHKSIKNIESAKLSIPYCVAAAVKKHDFNMNIFDGLIDVQRLIDKVEIVENDTYTANQINERCARVSITSRDNLTRTAEVRYAKGDPENPLTIDDIRNKCHNLADGTTLSLNYDKINHLLDTYKRYDRNTPLS